MNKFPVNIITTPVIFIGVQVKSSNNQDNISAQIGKTIIAYAALFAPTRPSNVK
jgi:hypothetical protein